MSNELVPAAKVATLRMFLDKCGKQLELAAAKHIDPKQLARVALSAAQRQPKLFDCTQQSLALSLLNCAELGLMPNVIGHAYLVPFYNNRIKQLECQLIIGYKGLLKLARNTGEVGALQVDVVREGDKFRYVKGLHPVLEHEPSAEPTDKRKITHVYAIANIKGTEPQWEVMTIAEVESIRSMSRAKDSGPWVDHYEEMVKKTVLRRLCKLLPASAELEKAVALDEHADAGLVQIGDMVDLGEVEELVDDKAAKLTERVEQSAAKKAKGDLLFGGEYDAWSDKQRSVYDSVRQQKLEEGETPEDSHAAGYAAATKVK